MIGRNHVMKGQEKGLIETVIAEYLFNNNFLDTSGNGYDANPASGVFVNDRDGNPLSAFDLNTRQTVDVPGPISLLNADSFKFSGWFYNTSTQLGIIWFVNNSSGGYIQASINSGLGGQFGLRVRIDASNDHRLVVDGLSASLNTWHFLEVYFDNSQLATTDKFIVKLDTIQDTGISVTSAIGDVSAGIGSVDNLKFSNSVGGTDFLGVIDDFRFYNVE